ncbi:threonine ammonia-lyase [Blastococcus sp. MG754426]|uniref:threonine ammonia-lyase n=1 Tax=unclassified Blastococcus TaxID=2619396 RepID=UPI001EF12F8D|nr:MULTISPECIES: threonine ammonia-lyase [unclassified Blastococcus]MCF6508663.1 threonine ammonia-lyase [Blastococcus sp. MG754426]MCF6513273.1 threonine ammonia-lyase [Blastococcus sp. MG754427]MCF6736601.1 threonine ammonia-lyase [Blastococcus sp. KM273129]
MSVPLVTGADVAAAAELLAGVVRRTPLEHSRGLADRVGGPVWLKCENLQRTGSFKIRGAYTRIARLTDEERARGVVAASAGNHAQGVALAARLLGAEATVYMPETAPLPKVAATQAYGARVEMCGQSLAEPLRAAAEHAERTGSVFIHPFDHPDVIAGQGTVGLEVLEQCPEVATVLVCAGGGGLVSGIAAAVKERRPDVRVVGVQAEEAAALPGSLAAGRPVALQSMSTMADGIAVPAPGDLTFAHVRGLVDEVRTVSEEDLSRALLFCLERAKMVVEPAGVAAVAAVLADPRAFEPPLVAVVSGGNIDPVLLLKVVQHGMAAAGRYLSLRLRIPDRPGSLAALLTELAAVGANVLEVEHERTATRLGIGEVEVFVVLETRGPAHAGEVIGAMRDAGYAVTPE